MIAVGGFGRITALVAAVAAVLATIGCSSGVRPSDSPNPPSIPAPTRATGAWPTEATTGVPAGVTLKKYTGSLTISTAGTVLDGYDITGTILIRASDVTIKNSRIQGRVDTGDANEFHRTLLERIEVIGPYDGDSAGYSAVGHSGFTCDGCNVRGWANGFSLVDDVTIKNSWVHDIIVHGDPANGGSHNQGILSLGGANFTIVGNRLDAGEAPNVTAAVALMSQQEPFKNVLVQGNLFDGGGYCAYGGQAGSYGATDTRFIDNTFGDKYSAECGGFGPATAIASGAGNQWTGNVLQSNGKAVRAS